MNKILLITVLFSQMYAGYIFDGWWKSDRLEYILNCTDNGTNRRRCECNLAYLEDEYVSYSSYRNYNYSQAEKITNAQGQAYESGNYDKVKRLKVKRDKEIKKMHTWVNKCLRGY